LKPKIVFPQDAADHIQLSESLTALVMEQGHAIWVANQASSSTDKSSSGSLRHYADALCAPLINSGHTLGAVHLYLNRGRFRQSDFDFTISVANIVSVALARARQHSTLASDYQRLVERSPGFQGMIGESAPMRELKSRIDRIARAAGCVLIRGESGTGKELVARAVHRASPRADRPLLSVNCAAIPHDLIESQLFGHKAGSFTGADRDHPGYFRQADLGTLFLDEVGELSLEGQAKLLRILEGHPFLPVGATEEVKVDVRVIAATNQNLQTYVREKKFREDLYYRLSVFELHLPPLRERNSDIGLLIDFFLDSFRQQHGRPRLTISEAARNKLLVYNWPGNVRQLRNVIDSAVVMAEGEAIETADLSLVDSGSGEMETLEITYCERKLIHAALRRTGGSGPEAAKLLGLGRATLYRKIDEYNIAR
jgi:transcriptional regulator with GAF, ATPase, and Fis domain